MTRNKKSRTARLRLVRRQDHATPQPVIMAFRSVEPVAEPPLSAGVSDADVRRAQELARTLGWNELVAS